MIPGEPLPDDLAYGHVEAGFIVKAFAIIVAECLLVQIPEEMEGFYRNIGAVDAPLQQRPEVFQAVGV